MKVLCIIPPYIPSYFNAGHHLAIFQVAEYLRSRFDNIKIECIDAAALNLTWKEICSLLIQSYDVIVIMNDFDAIDTFARFHQYVENISPSSKIITFGRLSKYIPRFFFRLGVDAVAYDGDYESSIMNYITYLQNNETLPKGVLLNENDKERAGEYLGAENWVMPNVNDIPYSAYNNMYKNDFNKFCGIPSRQELVIPVARGCPYACHFCDVPLMQGLKERRMLVDVVIAYIENSFKKLPFEYVTFYAPTFTLNKQWVNEFCRKIQLLPRNYPWKCVTVLACLDEPLVKSMAAAGCVRISLGIETFTHNASMKLPKVKQGILDKFIEMVNICKQYKVELNCFITLGLPGDTPKNVKYTIETCLSYDARVRPTIYTDYSRLKDTMSVLEVSNFNRQYFPPDYLSTEEALEYYKLFYDLKDDKATQVMDMIPVAPSTI